MSFKTILSGCANELVETRRVNTRKRLVKNLFMLVVLVPLKDFKYFPISFLISQLSFSQPLSYRFVLLHHFFFILRSKASFAHTPGLVSIITSLKTVAEGEQGLRRQ